MDPRDRVDALLNAAPEPAAFTMPETFNPFGLAGGLATFTEDAVDVFSSPDVLDDIGTGLIEAPGQILGGLIDMTTELSQLGDDAGQELERAIGIELPGIQFTDPETGEFSLDILSAEDLDRFRAEGRTDLPTTGAPDSLTGSAIRAISQFVLPFGKAAQALRALGVGARGSVAGRVAQTMGAGAVADATAFDPHQERLGNLIAEIPELEDSILAATAAHPDDSSWEGRLKSAAEGAGLGIFSDVLVAGIRAFRGTSRVQEASLRQSTTRQDAAAALGDADRPLVDVRAPSLDPDDLSAPPGDLPDVFINFQRIDTPEDVQTVMQRMADEDVSGITAAQRGVQSWDQTRALADELGMDVSALTARRQGQAFNAEEALAARRLWTSSSERLTAIARTAAENPSDANLYAFRRMMAVHTAIQRQVIGARTETARALQSWRIPAGGTEEAAEQIRRTLEATGGGRLTRELAQAIAEAGEILSPAQLGRIAQGGYAARTWRALQEVWINGLLSNPPTHLVNGISNFAFAFQSIFERRVAASIARVLGDRESVAVGEAMAQMHGMVSGLKDAFRVMINPDRASPIGQTLSKFDVPFERAISAQAWGVETPWIARAIDFTGRVVNTPGRLLEAGDRFFKAINYRMEVNAQAVRQASQEGVERGAFKQRVAELIDQPPESVRMAATAEAATRTFTNSAGPATAAIMRVRDKVPGFAFIMPFIRTPANILVASLERTPLAPLMKSFRREIAAGGARRDIALAKMSIGTGYVLTAMDLSLSGNISGGGPSDTGQRQALQRSGWQPYSIRIGDRWIQYSRLDPLGTLFGFGADFAEMMLNGGVPGQTADQQSVVSGVIAAVANTVTDKTYLSGLSDVVQAINDPGRFGGSWANRFAGSWVPAGVAGMTRALDPYLRDARTMVDALRRRTPGLSEDLPAQVDLWGRPVEFRSEMGTLYDLISPIRISEADAAPIDDEMLRLGHTPLRPSPRFTINGVRFDLTDNPELYHRYVALAGNGVENPRTGETAFEFLNSVVDGSNRQSGAYANLPDERKIDFIENTMNAYRELARLRLMHDEPAMQAIVLAARQRPTQ
ncbi:MAG: hypothetical protein ACFCVH_13880 [Alphaproteobacteria bacterium]